MGLEDLIRSGVTLAHSMTEGLQEDILLYRWISDNDQGKHVYANPLKLKAIVDHTTKRLGFDVGVEIIATTTITVLTPIKKLSPVVSGREEPIDERDKILFVDTTMQAGPILQTAGGLKDPKTGRPYLMQVFLGGYQAGR